MAVSPKTQTRLGQPANRLQPKIWPPKPERNRCVQTQPKSHNRAENPEEIVRLCWLGSGPAFSDLPFRLSACRQRVCRLDEEGRPVQTAGPYERDRTAQRSAQIALQHYTGCHESFQHYYLPNNFDIHPQSAYATGSRDREISAASVSAAPPPGSFPLF